MAIAYFKTVLNIALQIMTMILLVGIGKTFVNTYYTNMSSSMNLKEMGVMLIVAVILLVLTNKVPAMIGGIAMGGGTGALGNGFGAGTAMAATGVAGSMMAAGGAALLAGAANTAGGAQALSAAFQKASADVSGGGSSLSGGTPDYNSGGGSGSSSQQTAANPESTPLGKAMGLSSSSSTTPGSVSGGDSSSSGISNVAMITAGTASNLASGVGQVAKEKFQNFKDSVQNRIDQTLPGQVATAIRNDMPSFGENSIGGDDSHDPQAEVDAFINRSAQA